MLVDEKLLEDGTLVLLFNDDKGNDYICGKIVDSEITNYGNNYVIKYIVLDKDENKYECNYRKSLTEAAYFFTVQECVDYLRNQIIENELIVDKMTKEISKINRLSEMNDSENRYKNEDTVISDIVIPTPIFSTKEQEEMFFKCAMKSMYSKSGLHWDGKDEDDKVYSLK